MEEPTNESINNESNDTSVKSETTKTTTKTLETEEEMLGVKDLNKCIESAYLCWFKTNTQCIVLSDLRLRTVPNLLRFNNLKCLFIIQNKIESLTNLPSSLKYLNCSYNPIQEINELPLNLEKFVCINNEKKSKRLRKLPATLPPKLYVINVVGCDLESFPENNHSLKKYYGDFKFCPEHLKETFKEFKVKH